MALNYAFFVSGKLFSVISKGLSLGANDHLNLPRPGGIEVAAMIATVGIFLLLNAENAPHTEC